jgi:putative endonuclease
MTEAKCLGNLGEKIAEKYLIKRGYRILVNNFRVGHKELDLIVKRHGLITAFEVKTRKNWSSTTGRSELGAEECLTRRQTRRLQIALQAYCYKNRLKFETAQGDLIIVLINTANRSAQIKHYPKIF